MADPRAIEARDVDAGHHPATGTALRAPEMYLNGGGPAKSTAPNEEQLDKHLESSYG